MRQFYLVIQNGAPLEHHLTWSHYKYLLPLKDINKINYYIKQCITYNLSKRELERKIKSKEYERLDDKTKEKLINQENIEVQDLIKNPIIIKIDNTKEVISESFLKNAILENVEEFLKELGEGFCYIDNEYKIKIENKYNYIDILLYNIEFNCYVVVELKITELKKEYIGQIMTYMRYIDNNIKKINQNKTIGIIICKEDNKFIKKIYYNDNIYSTIYELEKSQN